MPKKCTRNKVVRLSDKKERLLDEAQYAFTYVVDKYKRRLRQGADNICLCELMREIANPIYPTCIRRELRRLAEGYTR